MKTSLFSPRLWAGLAALPLATLAQTPAAPGAATPPTAPASSREEGLRFNFRGAPLESVLNYLSEAAGFVIVLETPVRGTIDTSYPGPADETLTDEQRTRLRERGNMQR